MFGKRDHWKAAMIGALTCALGGPEIALLLMALWGACRASSIHDATEMLGLPLLWIFAFIPVGPPALVLGGIGGVVLQSLAQKSQSLKAIIAEAVALGLVLGCIAPLSALLWGWGPIPNVVSSLPLAAATGIICALTVLWLLHRAHLLHLHVDSRLPS
jgi:hypothetical protein